eukprot:UN24648
MFEATQGVVEWDDIFQSRVTDDDYIDWENMAIGGSQNEDGTYGIGYLPELGLQRYKIGRAVLMIYVLVGLIMLLNLLIAMMAETYNSVQEDSSREYAFILAETIYEFHTASTVLPAPVNIAVYAIYAPLYFQRILSCVAIRELTSKNKRGGKPIDGERWICGFCHERN